MKHQGFLDLNFAKLDINRQTRRGFPEVIYAPGKKTKQLKIIVKKLSQYTDWVFISRLDLAKYKFLKKYFPKLRYFKEANTGFLGKEIKQKKGLCLIITAGTSDMKIAEEAAVFLNLTGNCVEKIYDVGVAGVHRLESFKERIQQAKVIIVIAGMEAALLSVVSGLSSAPLIGVPTSVGYGAAFKGLAALLGMLNSCSLGSTIVNIDNGLGAGYFANMINK